MLTACSFFMQISSLKTGIHINDVTGIQTHQEEEIMFFGIGNKKKKQVQAGAGNPLPFSTSAAPDRKSAINVSNRQTDIQIDETLLESAMQKLDKMTGLSSIKQDVRNLVQLQKLNIERENRGMKTAQISNHLIFLGNPGTGKTTVARIIADIYKALNVVEHGQLIETDRSGLIGQYQGQTEQKTKQILSEADGGILFIDEAYSLASGENDYGQRAIEIILKEMEDNRNNLVVIVAGYPNEMQRFLNSNPGLSSRFGKTLQFENYSPDEMYVISQSYAMESGYILDNSCFDVLNNYYASEYKKPDFANGRLARKTVEACIKAQAVRLTGKSPLIAFSDRDLNTIEKADCQKAIQML